MKADVWKTIVFGFCIATNRDSYSKFGPAGVGDLLLIDDCRDFQVLAKLKEQAREFYAGET